MKKHAPDGNVLVKTLHSPWGTSAKIAGFSERTAERGFTEERMMAVTDYRNGERDHINFERSIE